MFNFVKIDENGKYKLVIEVVQNQFARITEQYL